MRLHALGYSQKEIAERLGCTPATVGNVVNSSLGQLHTGIIRKGIDEASMEAAKRVRALAPAALDVIEDILASSDVPSAVRLRAAQDALDRAGFGAVRKMDVHTTSLSLTSDDLAAIKADALSRAMKNGLNKEIPQSLPSLEAAPRVCEHGEEVGQAPTPASSSAPVLSVIDTEVVNV